MSSVPGPNPPFRVYAAAYVCTLVIFTGIDFVWLSAMASYLYQPILGDMLAPQPRMLPAVIFYLFYAGGLTYLAVRPGLKARSARLALVNGAVLGFTAYATYDLTNQATLRDWPWRVTIADLCWGTLVTAVAAAVACRITAWLATPP